MSSSITDKSNIDKLLSPMLSSEVTSLTPLYNFHPLHRDQGISRKITAESSPLHIASIRT